MLHCAQSTLLWAQACGLDLGEWAHPIYIQAISNRSQRHMHTHNRADSLPHSFSLLCSLSQQCSLRSWDKWEREELRQRDPRHRGDLLPHQAVHSMPAVRESVILAPAAWCWLALLPLLSGRQVWSDRPPDSRPPGPLTPCSRNADHVLSVPARDFKGAECRQYQKRWGAQVGNITGPQQVKTDKRHFILPRGIFQIQNAKWRRGIH